MERKPRSKAETMERQVPCPAFSLSATTFHGIVSDDEVTSGAYLPPVSVSPVGSKEDNKENEQREWASDSHHYCLATALGKQGVSTPFPSLLFPAAVSISSLGQFRFWLESQQPLCFSELERRSPSPSGFVYGHAEKGTPPPPRTRYNSSYCLSESLPSIRFTLST